MKIKDIFTIEEIDGKVFMVCLDSSVLSGMIELNETAAFIAKCLSEDTTPEEIANKVSEEYDVTPEEALIGVQQMISQFREIRVIED